MTIRALKDSVERQFLERLRRLGSATIQDICTEIGVTATAVRQRLARLQAQEFVAREVVRSGRGRPHHTYRVTDLGVRELGENYSDLAPILWREVRSIDEPVLRERVTGRIVDAMVDQYRGRVHAENIDERVKQLCTALTERGFDMEVDLDGPLPILRENNCPYPDLTGEDEEICRIEQSMFRRILGADVVLKHCKLDGHNCCEFHVNKQETTHSHV